MTEHLFLYLVLGVVGIWCLRRVFIRLQLSVAKHPSLRGHAKMSRRFAKLVPYFSYNKHTFFASDMAPNRVASQRAKALVELTNSIEMKYGKTMDYTRSLTECISDVRFTNNYRVPFPYREQLPLALKATPVADESSGTKIKDIDGNWRHDLFASYGVNVFGYDFYKACMREGSQLVEKLGPVLGPYHPLIKDNVERLKEISGLDEVSFHMSGTEAVMQAVRLARYHTGKTHLVRFCGAYHGWWDGVQPGIGNQRKTNDVYTLADLSEKTIRVLSTRNDIACVLINPMQAFHPNSDSPSDATLIVSDRQTNFDKAVYTKWLQKIRNICSERGIVLIFDEVFTGFRLSYQGAQGYFGVKADLVTYGKTLGGGYPIGAVCGLSHLMKRYRDNAPADLSFARGTFNSHPAVIGAMNVFLKRIAEDDIQCIYRNAESVWNKRVQSLNTQLEQENLPLKLSNMHSIISVLYKKPSRYNWMFQFYLRAEGLEPGWIGTGRFIMSLDYSDDDFAEVSEKLIAAAHKMDAAGWWWHDGQTTNKQLKRMFLNDMLSAKFPKLAGLVGNKANPEEDINDQAVSL
ncbi:aminotransferase class III-fold pyridoxal phosphate-dependent enzyme [Glaciecola petra]|uniref:Aminotransferase class III-fold pyridoxal phosphate-dependent enzyme n=1 Tax=Glaciecola petra TaxID=3075602 RepID=A0ABU2ZRZ5_9ALTE|nr:aminotransferase class III-fold pyridoxal phosphate-dependent enzyme [Aestuariibacter sp. P117]MDT0595176.1 aminotransferase class III-fold pyridoxal phosphate-dependent enzyme [Aestuariibacter sp. P117]